MNETYAASSSDAKAYATVSWVLHDTPLSPVEQMSLSVLGQVLMGTSSAPLRKRLTDSGLGSSVIGGGLDDELQQASPQPPP